MPIDFWAGIQLTKIEVRIIQKKYISDQGLPAVIASILLILLKHTKITAN